MRAEEASPKAVGGSDGTGVLAIVGSGVVGTATGAGFQAKGYRVVLCDTSLDRVALLRRQGFWSIDGASLANLHPDAYFISVPTPTVEGRVDLSFVEAAAQAVGRAMIDHPGHPLVVVRSTVPPGTTEDLVGPAVGFASGREPGRGCPARRVFRCDDDSGGGTGHKRDSAEHYEGAPPDPSPTRQHLALQRRAGCPYELAAGRVPLLG